jgi:hypothetical protein
LGLWFAIIIIVQFGIEKLGSARGFFVFLFISILLTLSDPSSIVSVHQSWQAVLGFLFYVLYLIFGILFTSLYLVNNKMEDTWKKKILGRDKVTWKDGLKVYKYHFLVIILIWVPFLLLRIIMIEL